MNGKTTHPDNALRARLAPASVALREAQERAAAMVRGPADDFDAACLEAHEAGYSLAAIGRAIGERAEMVQRRVEHTRVVRDRDLPAPPVPLPTVGMVRLRPGGMVHRRWGAGDGTYLAVTLCGRPVTGQAVPAEPPHRWCGNCAPQPARVTVVTTRPMPRLLGAALRAVAPEVDAARAEARFEQARRARREAGSSNA